MRDRVTPRAIGQGQAHIDESPALAPARASGSARDAAAAALENLGVHIDADAREVQAIPRRGPVLFVANHPYGAVDGLIGLALLGAVRPDLKVLANDERCALPELAPHLVPFGIDGPARTQRNARALRDGPAVESRGGVARSTCARTARTGAHRRPPRPADPRRGIIHPASRSLPLRRQLRRPLHREVRVRVGMPLPFDRLRHFEDEVLAAHLRLSTYLLSGDERSTGGSAAPAPRRWHPVVPPVAPTAGAHEVARLAPEQRLIEDAEHVVLRAPGAAIPNLLDEIGRLREVVACTAGLGTGRGRDLDAQDAEQEHLVLRRRDRGEILGAHRVTRIVRWSRRGPRALPIDGRFRLRGPLHPLLGPAILLDRSFVRAEQRHTSVPTQLLWKGVGRYLAHHPGAVRLLGDLRMRCAASRSRARSLPICGERPHSRCTAARPTKPSRVCSPRAPSKPRAPRGVIRSSALRARRLA